MQLNILKSFLILAKYKHKKFKTLESEWIKFIYLWELSNKQEVILKEFLNEKKIIISMRDYGAATHLIELVKYLTEEDRFDITVVAQKPASNLLKLNNINHINIELDASENKDSILSKKIIKKAYEIVKVIKPTFIICGLSTPFDGGIDEAFYFISNKNSLFCLSGSMGRKQFFFWKIC